MTLVGSSSTFSRSLPLDPIYLITAEVTDIGLKVCLTDLWGWSSGTVFISVSALDTFSEDLVWSPNSSTSRLSSIIFFLDLNLNVFLLCACKIKEYLKKIFSFCGWCGKKAYFVTDLHPLESSWNAILWAELLLARVLSTAGCINNCLTTWVFTH